MKRTSAWHLALVLVLGLLAGTSCVGKEPGPGSFGQVAVGSESTTAPRVPPSVPDSSAPDSSVQYEDRPTPARLRIPAIDVAGNIQPVGMSDAVTMQVPDDISVIGWFNRSVVPISEVGNTVLVGHRDGSQDPNGVFRRLEELRPGDDIRVRDLSGRRIDYEVSSVELVSNDDFALQAEDFFAVHGPHRLVLLTCGGTYDASRGGGYQANVVVVATRA